MLKIFFSLVILNFIATLLKTTALIPWMKQIFAINEVNRRQQNTTSFKPWKYMPKFGIKNHTYKSYGIIHLIVLPIVAILIFAGYFIWKINFQNSNITLPESISTIINQDAPVPTPFLFQEMTIPSLRSRTYESALGELEEISENNNYTSYLTNYK